MLILGPLFVYCPHTKQFIPKLYNKAATGTVFAGVKAAPPYRPHPQLWHFVEEKKKKKKLKKKN